MKRGASTLLQNQLGLILPKTTTCVVVVTNVLSAVLPCIQLYQLLASNNSTWNNSTTQIILKYRQNSKEKCYLQVLRSNFLLYCLSSANSIQSNIIEITPPTILNSTQPTLTQCTRLSTTDISNDTTDTQINSLYQPQRPKNFPFVNNTTKHARSFLKKNVFKTFFLKKNQNFQISAFHYPPPLMTTQLSVQYVFMTLSNIVLQ